MDEEEKLGELWAIKFIESGELWGHTSREIYAFRDRESANALIGDHSKMKAVRLKIEEDLEDQS